MGCDYYIIKVLQIYYSDNEYLEVEINRERCYYNDYQLDEDAEDYDEQLNNYIIEDILNVKMVPITIYSNSMFNKLSCESKYKGLVENELNKHHKTIFDVVKIVKVEKRHIN